jgi:hypothetical protein
MKTLTKKLLETERSESDKYDELVSLVDSDEVAAQVLDDTVYVIAGVLNGGLKMLAESSLYNRHYHDSMSFLGMSARSYYEESGPVGQFLKLMRGAKEAISDYRDALRTRDEDEIGAVFEETFAPVADSFEEWLYNLVNLESLSSALIDVYHRMK